MAALARAMGEPINGLAPREVTERVLDTIHYLIKSVNLPTTLTDLAGSAGRRPMYASGRWKPTRSSGF